MACLPRLATCLLAAARWGHAGSRLPGRVRGWPAGAGCPRSRLVPAAVLFGAGLPPPGGCAHPPLPCCRAVVRVRRLVPGCRRCPRVVVCGRVRYRGLLRTPLRCFALGLVRCPALRPPHSSGGGARAASGSLLGPPHGPGHSGQGYECPRHHERVPSHVVVALGR